MGARVLAAGLALATLVAAPAFATDFVGAETCRTCHQPEYDQWKSSGHATALARLSPVQQRDRVCRSCHTMSPLSEEQNLAGVQCESCHGPGSFYALRYVMKDRTLAHLLGLKDVAEESCAGCHTSDGPSVVPFTFKDKVDQVRHIPVKGEKEGTKKEATSLRIRIPLSNEAKTCAASELPLGAYAGRLGLIAHAGSGSSEKR
jgi:hypothetical protein